MKILWTILQSFIFFVLFAVGSFMHPFNLHWAEKRTPDGMHYFIPDGLLLALGVFLAIVIVQSLRKRTCDTPHTVLAFVLAVTAGYIVKLGFITTQI